MENPTSRRPLMTTAELLAWLQVTENWLRPRLKDPNFPAIDISPAGSTRSTWRFDADAIAAYLKMSAPPWPDSEKTAA